ncbi:MAG: hypothetical protein IPQ25_10790 [Chitinophagaceae bacterium]|nr:hypothetical protein [Chitinophagaceae bacterium]
MLENTGRLFINGKDEYWSYRVKYAIMNSLIATDKIKSLAYGKQQLAQLEKSKTPNARLISSGFMRQLRLPYRNSNTLNEGFQYFNENLKKYKLKMILQALQIVTMYWLVFTEQLACLTRQSIT